MPEAVLLRKILRGLAKERTAGMAGILGKGFQLLRDSAMARIYLRRCDRFGAGARVRGRPRILNEGRIDIGEEFFAHAEFAPLEMVTAPGGEIAIGDSVWINYGTAIHARKRVQIGDRSQVGQYSILTDTEVPDAEGEEPRPIRIGADVWIAGRVTVLPGTIIGDGAVITAGSVVSGVIPAGVVAGGIPARVLRRIDGNRSSEGPPATADAGPALVAASAPEKRTPVEPALRGVLIADFTIDEMANQLGHDGDPPALAAEVAPLGQVTQSLLQGPVADFAVVWTRPEAALQGFRRLLDFETVTVDELLAEVDAFCALLINGARRFKSIFVPTWMVAPWQRGLGAIDAREMSVDRAVLAINRRLYEVLAPSRNVHVLPAQRWIGGAGRGFTPKGWYLGKVAFHDEVLAEATRDVKAALRGLGGQARKLLIFDLDDTLWGGILGDVGWAGLQLGGHDAEGEAFVDLQRAAKALTRRGVVLGIVSKNEEAVAREAIGKHPEMVLHESDLVGWRINWNDKARNIVELAAELNLGLQSVVFIDDNPVERARVREALPEVLVPEWPADKLLGPSTLLGLRCFDAPSITREDAERTQLYGAETRRDALLRQVGSVDEWLKGLQVRVSAEPLGAANLARAAQLLNKTNQLNLSTRRLAEAELREWATREGRWLRAITVADRFGGAGLTGIVSLETNGKLGRIVDFVLSCRVMGRKVEETMLHLALSEAARRGLTEVEALYVPTTKNKPCLSFFQSSGMKSEPGGRFVWSPAAPFPLPEAVTLEALG